MRKKLTPNEKIKSCKALQGKSVRDIIELPGFLTNLESYVTQQRAEWESIQGHARMRSKMSGKDLRPKRHPVADTLAWDMEQWKAHFLAVMDKQSILPHALREYVYQLGMQAYFVTFANIVLVEFPELREYFFGKSKVV